MASRRARAAAGAAAVLVAATVGYGAADAYDVVPGRLTVQPPPAPPTPFPTAPGATEAPPAGDVLAAVDATAPRPDPAALSAVLLPLLRNPALGGSVSASVVDAVTGEPLFQQAARVPREPASVVKLLTGVAALSRLGPDTTVPTRAVQGVTEDEVVLVGGGDVLLSAGAGEADAVNGRAGLADLAAQTAGALRSSGRTTVALRLDDTAFTGPRTGPGWSPSDVRNGFAAPVTAVAVDAGRLQPEPYAARVDDPALSAATTFAALLAAEGVTVAGPVVRTVAPQDPTLLGEVRSAPVEDLVAYMLRSSDNTLAEALAHLVAVELGRPAEFADASASVLEEVARLGVDTSSARLVDGSGLGEGATLPPALLTDVLALAASPDRPELRAVLTGLPVAGLTGTLTDRFGDAPPAQGLVRGKTGTLTGVTTLAGTVVDADGRLLAFALMADQVGATAAARAATDAVAAALAGCGCR